MDNKKDDILRALLPEIENKKVLDVGCVEHDIKNKNKERIWVHDFLRKHTKQVIGIDILKKDIDILRKQKYDVHFQNAESFHFDEKFDVIFAGELIEHLSNPGVFLRRCRLHLKKGGVLIITTPNAFGLYRLIVSILMLKNDPPVNPEHTAWYSPRVIRSLLERHSFDMIRTSYVNYPYLRPRLDIRIINNISRFFPRLRETMIVFAVRV